MVPDPHSRRPRLFLSYGHRDAMELALRLRNEFEAAGYSVWQDEKRIRAGRAWTDEIRQGLRESDLVIALLSPTVPLARKDLLNTACGSIIEASMSCEGDQALLQGLRHRSR